ncbi:MAG: hypothetical protein ACE5DI_06340 [Candidatus Micrarchaeia archaeon]
MTNYEKGRRFEKELVNFFSEHGATVSIRSAGSRGVVDGVAVPHEAVAFKGFMSFSTVVWQAKLFKGLRPKPTKEFKKLRVAGVKLWVTCKKGTGTMVFEVV